MLGAGVWSSKTAVSSLVGNKYVRSTRFASIGSGTSGTVTLPSASTVVLDDFGGTVDAVVSTISGGKPTQVAAVTATGTVVSTTFDSSGNYVLSGTPSAYPVAIIYRVQQTLIAFDSASADIWGDTDIDPVSSGGGGAAEFDPLIYSIEYYDFTQAGIAPALSTGGGGGTAASKDTATFGSQPTGIVKHWSGPATGFSTIYGQEAYQGSGVTFKARIHINTLSTAVEEFIVAAGFMTRTNATHPPENGIYLSYDRTASVNWRGHTSSGTTVTSVDLGVAVAAGSWIALEYQLNLARTSVSFFINGTAVGSAITTNIPTPTSYGYPLTKIMKTVGATERYMHTDVLYLKSFK